MNQPQGLFFHPDTRREKACRQLTTFLTNTLEPSLIKSSVFSGKTSSNVTLSTTFLVRKWDFDSALIKMYHWAQDLLVGKSH